MNNDPATILGVAAEAGDKQIRAAYLRKVREFPPDRAPAEFERIREAYEALRDPRQRSRLLLHADPEAPLVSLLETVARERRFVGPDSWLAALREP